MIRSRASGSGSVAISCSPAPSPPSATRPRERFPHFLDHALVEHGVGARDDAAFELRRGHVEPRDQCRVPGGARPETVVLRDERLAAPPRARARERRAAGRSRGLPRPRAGRGCRGDRAPPAGSCSTSAQNRAHARLRREAAGPRGRRAPPAGTGRSHRTRPRCRCVSTSSSIAPCASVRICADGHLLVDRRGSPRAPSGGSAGSSGSEARGTPAARRTETTSVPSRSAITSATAVFPDAVGPKTAITCGHRVTCSGRNGRGDRGREAWSRSIPRSRRRRGRPPAPRPRS